MKRFLFVFLIILMAGVFFSCAHEHVDLDKDGICESCAEAYESPAKDVTLIKNGEAQFRIVYEDGLDIDCRRKIKRFEDFLKKEEIAISCVDEHDESVEEIEILIGDVTTRGTKYIYDKYKLGVKGYVFKIIDSKIIINAGSTETLVQAIQEFFDSVFGTESGSAYNVKMKTSDQKEIIQSDYSVTSVSVNHVNMKDYTIALDKDNTYHSETAEDIQNAFYSKTGYWLNIVGLDEMGSSIVIKGVKKNAVPGGFRISTNDENQLVIECGYDTSLRKAVAGFLNEKLLSNSGSVDFSGCVYEADVSVLYYEDFGAVGDGITDDFEAIKATHELANISGQLVKATPGKTYRIVETKSSAVIKTNVDWTGAEFIIDDTGISPFKNKSMAGIPVFVVKPDSPAEVCRDKEKLNAIIKAGLGQDTDKIDLGLGYAAMIVPYNSSHKVYRRKGYSSFEGGSMHEVIVLDKHGNVDTDTPIMFDYSNLSYINIYRLDEEALTIEGGKFTTIASNTNTVSVDSKGNKKANDIYIQRGISVRRSYTTVKNVEHYVVGEITLNQQKQGMLGAGYSGFFNASSANSVTFENCVLTGRRCYTKSSAGLSGGTQGTYDFGANTVNKIVLKNCTQSNFFVTIDEEGNIIPAAEDAPGVQLSMATSQITGMKMHWGIGGTNYCKNMEYIGSTLSRFDAHSGLYNGKIIDSTVNYIALTGVGDMIIENSRWFAEAPSYNSNSLIHLRSDYGSTWDGIIKVNNVKAYVFTTYDTFIYMHTYSNWYYGYVAAFPSIEINNLDYYDIKTREPLAAEYEIKLCRTSVTSEPALHLPETQKTAPYYPDVDKNKDGYVDGTNILFDGSTNNSGIRDTSSRINFNPIKPPKYIKITGNDGVLSAGGYIYVVPRTDAFGVSDGGYYDEIENNGGFFGDTKFITETNTYLGTNHTNSETFVFE
jgi:hypothetical protein